ncbi:Kielin/chordin-like protein, partial [Stegodyphus mimosarum]
MNGTNFTNPRNSCETCICEEGDVYCTKKPCEPPNCINVIDDPESCCPYCSNNCIYNGKKYDIGTVFPHSVDVCQECTCLAGDVHCSVKKCADTTCSHPAFGPCCLECINCQYLGRIYVDGT